MVLLAAALVSCNVNKLIFPESPPASAALPYRNPHTHCPSCHETIIPPSSVSPFKPGANTACPDCHDYQENHHPVDFLPEGKSGLPFPLFEGKMRCLTCHEIHGGPDSKGTPRLLRGGPYIDRREICFKCHSKERYSTINPHRMLEIDGSVRNVDGKPVCLVCHSIKPNPAVDWTDDVRFRADVGFLCWRCHPPMADPFFSDHFLITPTEETLQTMRETEERLIVILPLVPRNRITCSTCHNPHQEGVIQHEAAAKGADATHGLRLPSICFACHRM